MQTEPTRTDAAGQTSADSNSPIVTSLSSEATMARYLMEVGWVLHVVHDEPGNHKLVKVDRGQGSVIRFQECPISADAIIELNSAKLLRKTGSIRIGIKESTHYEIESA